MKTKKFDRSLTLNKHTVANLRNEAMAKIQGGATDGSCYQICLDPTEGGSVPLYLCPGLGSEACSTSDYTS